MHQIYLAAAVIGGTILVAQFGLQLLGFGHDTMSSMDVDSSSLVHGGQAGHVSHADASSVAPLKLLTLQTIAAFLTFFGLGSLAGESAGNPPVVATGVGTLLGLASMYFVAYLMRGLYLLQNDGTFRTERVVGHVASVTVRIPEQNQGEGKIHVVVDGRLVELGAKTAGRSLATGEKATILSLLDPSTVEVALPEHLHEGTG